MSGPRVCSRAGCTEAARWVVAWRNPRIHAADRRKLWGACDDHAGYLREHLSARGFPVVVEPFTAERSATAQAVTESTAVERAVEAQGAMLHGAGGAGGAG